MMRQLAKSPRVISVILVPLLLISASCSKADQTIKIQPKAAIIDQLGLEYPNERFIREVTQTLQNNGFDVTLFNGNQVTVDLYRKLPAYGFKFVIFRTHSHAPPDNETSIRKTFLFTNEPYSKSRYVAEQLTDRITRARVDANSPDYFTVSSDFIASSSQGGYDKSIIIMMGCSSLYTPDMAEAFISNGALFYIGWNASVELNFVDDYIITLVNNLCNKGCTFKDAIYKTAYEKGIDPLSKAQISYYPSENDCYSLIGSN